MKKVLLVLSLLSLVVIISAVSAKAQSQSIIEMDVPFDFSVGSKEMGSGLYGLRISRNAAGGVILNLLDYRGRNVQTLLARINGDAGPGPAEVIFTSYTGGYFLTAVATTYGRIELIPSKQEKEIAAKSSSTSERRSQISQNVK